MQTFLPYADFTESANVLDKKRCWKQVVEAHQIMSILVKREKGQVIVSSLKEAKVTKEPIHEIIPWVNHPAVQMWIGYKIYLIKYFNAFLKVCIDKHGINTKYTELIYFTRKPPEIPWWLGNENFHRAMRSRLIEKDRDFYLPLFPKDEGYNDGKYFWPVMETKTFRII